VFFGGGSIGSSFALHYKSLHARRYHDIWIGGNPAFVTLLFGGESLAVVDEKVREQISLILLDTLG
jgi:hypothetical protein